MQKRPMSASMKEIGSRFLLVQCVCVCVQLVEKRKRSLTLYGPWPPRIPYQIPQAIAAQTRRRPFPP